MPGNGRIRDSTTVLVCGVLQLVSPLAIYSSCLSKRTLFFLPKKLVKFQFCPGFVRSCLGKAWQFVIELNCFHLVQVPRGSFFTQLLISELACPCPLSLSDSPICLVFSASSPLFVGLWGLALKHHITGPCCLPVVWLSGCLYCASGAEWKASTPDWEIKGK